jgi:hypothetical protein
LHDHTNPETCLECAIKHVGAAMIHLSEAMASSDPERLKRRLLEVTFDLNEAETTHLAGKYPELAQEVRQIRKKIEEAALGAEAQPNVTREDLERIISDLLAQREREAEGGVKCSACSRTVAMDTSVEIDPRYAKVVGDNMQEAVKVLLDMESAKYGIPVPEVIFEENVQLCPGTSCTVMDQKNPIRSTKIFLNPKQYSPRTILHEWNHYGATVKGAEGWKAKMKELYGADFTGDPDSEEEADRFALLEMQGLFPNQVVAADSQGINTGLASEGAKMSGQVTVYRDSNVFANLDGAYRWAEGWTHLSAKDLNEAYTPEILGTALETGIDITFTPSSSVAVNIITGLILAGIGAFAPSSMIGAEDRKMLKEWEAHHVTRVITYADPKNLSAASAQARTLGRMVGAGQFQAAAQATLNPTSVITTGFRSALNSVAALGGIPRNAQIPQTNEQHSSTSVSGTGGAPPFQ